MVSGLKRFREYFEKHAHKYTLIGGCACDLHFDELGLSFRKTKDFDVVLLIENIDDVFIYDFKRFIYDGGYQKQAKSNGSKQVYRFNKPTDSSFPYMIEVLSKETIENDQLIGHTQPIVIDEKSISISAILLDNHYYDFIKENLLTIHKVSVVTIEALILLKIKAWLNLIDDPKSDRNDCKKHKNDVFRLLSVVHPNNKISVSQFLYSDISEFITRMEVETTYVKDIGITSFSFDDLIHSLKNLFVNND